jgi:hypothetical protein
MAMPRRPRPTIEQRAQQLLDQARHRWPPDDHRAREELMSWISVEDREKLWETWEAAREAGDDDGELAAQLQLEALLLLAQKRKANGLPRY